MTDNVLPNKLQVTLPCDSGEGLSFNPLGKVVDCYDNEFIAFWGNGKGHYQVDSPLGRRPHPFHGDELLVGSSGHWCK